MCDTKPLRNATKRGWFGITGQLAIFPAASKYGTVIFSLHSACGIDTAISCPGRNAPLAGVNTSSAGVRHARVPACFGSDPSCTSRTGAENVNVIVHPACAHQPICTVGAGGFAGNLITGSILAGSAHGSVFGSVEARSEMKQLTTMMTIGGAARIDRQRSKMY